MTEGPFLSLEASECPVSDPPSLSVEATAATVASKVLVGIADMVLAPFMGGCKVTRGLAL